jgi:hypothetical protein
LYQLAQSVGIKANPAFSRELLIALLIGDEESTLTEALHTFDSWRLGIIGFLEDHWAILEPQIKCPAKDMKRGLPRPCFGCIDTQVVSCITKNDENVEARIAQHRPERKE